MCASMVDIQCPTAEIRRGNKKRKKKKPQDENIYVRILLCRAAINYHDPRILFWNTTWSSGYHRTRLTARVCVCVCGTLQVSLTLPVSLSADTATRQNHQDSIKYNLKAAIICHRRWRMVSRCWITRYNSTLSSRHWSKVRLTWWIVVMERIFHWMWRNGWWICCRTSWRIWCRHRTRTTVRRVGIKCRLENIQNKSSKHQAITETRAADMQTVITSHQTSTTCWQISNNKSYINSPVDAMVSVWVNQSSNKTFIDVLVILIVTGQMVPSSHAPPWMVDEEEMRPGQWLGSVFEFPSVLWHCWLGDTCTTYHQRFSSRTSWRRKRKADGKNQVHLSMKKEVLMVLIMLPRGNNI